jgi:hypothetical protein
MLFRALFWLVGYSLAVSGGICVIAYMNFLTMGNSFGKYFSIITRHAECYLLPIGLFIVTASIYSPGKDKAN